MKTLHPTTPTSTSQPSRRSFLKNLGVLTLGAGTVGSLTGCLKEDIEEPLFQGQITVNAFLDNNLMPNRPNSDPEERRNPTGTVTIEIDGRDASEYRRLQDVQVTIRGLVNGPVSGVLDLVYHNSDYIQTSFPLTGNKHFFNFGPDEYSGVNEFPFSYGTIGLEIELQFINRKLQNGLVVGEIVRTATEKLLYPY